MFKRKQKIMKSIELKNFLNLTENNIFRKHSETKYARFYRCLICRTAKIRKEIIYNGIFMVTGHTKHCQSRKIVCANSKLFENFNIKDNKNIIIQDIKDLTVKSNINIENDENNLIQKYDSLEVMKNIEKNNKLLEDSHIMLQIHKENSKIGSIK